MDAKNNGSLPLSSLQMHVHVHYRYQFLTNTKVLMVLSFYVEIIEGTALSSFTYILLLLRKKIFFSQVRVGTRFIGPMK